MEAFIFPALLGLVGGVLLMALFSGFKNRNTQQENQASNDNSSAGVAKHGFFSNPDRSDVSLARFLLILIVLGFLISFLVPDGPSGSEEIRQAVENGQIVDCGTREECMGQFWSILLSGRED